MAKNSCFPLYDGARYFELGCHMEMQTPRSKLPLRNLVAAEQRRCRTTLESLEIDDAVHHLPSRALRGATATCQCLVQELLTQRLAPCCCHLEVRFLFDEAWQSTIHTRSSLSACAQMYISCQTQHPFLRSLMRKGPESSNLALCCSSVCGRWKGLNVIRSVSAYHHPECSMSVAPCRPRKWQAEQDLMQVLLLRSLALRCHVLAAERAKASSGHAD